MRNSDEMTGRFGKIPEDDRKIREDASEFRKMRNFTLQTPNLLICNFDYLNFRWLNNMLSDDRNLITHCYADNALF